jgi:hypothetical protein
MMDMIDLLQLRIAQQRDRIEAGHFLAHRREAGLETGEALHRRLGSHMLVMIEQGLPDHVLHRHDRLLEPAFRPGMGGALLALDGISVHIVA